MEDNPVNQRLAVKMFERLGLRADLAADALAGSREACLSAGMDDFILKPVGLPEIAAALEKWGEAQPVR